MTFPYIEINKRFYPAIDITLYGRSLYTPVKALVDSGASFSLFHSAISEDLNINFVKGQQIILEGVGGRILGYKHTIPASVNGKKFLLRIVFSQEFKASFNILGRNNFFENFLITFNEKRRLVSLDYSNN